jgi:general secretion pathway protein K
MTSSAAGAPRGFALVAVLLVLALLSVIGAEFAFSMRLEASMVRSFRDGIVATHLAEAAVEQAMREILTDAQQIGTLEDGVLTFFRSPLQPLPRLPRDAVKLGAGEFSYRISDEDARLNVNRANTAVLDRLLTVLGLEKRLRDTIIDSLQDWRDPNELHRANGAESEDTYLNRPVPYRAKNAALDSVAELIQIKGVTPKLMDGEDGRPGLAAFVTVRGQSQVNVNTAPREVLKALGVSDAQFSRIEQTRRLGPYTTLQGLNIGGVSPATITFRIDAQGIVDGQVRARLTAIVQKRPGAGGETLAVLEWSGVR